MGGDLDTFWMMWGVPPKTTVMENPGDPKFPRPTRLLDSFAETFSRKALSFEFIFCMAVNHHDWNLLNRFRSLMTLRVFSKVSLKGAISGLKQVLANENPSKMMKNAFYFTLKALFVLKIFTFLSWLFGHV